MPRARASCSVSLKAFSKYVDTTEALQSATALVEGRLSSGMKKFLKKNIVSKEITDTLAVADAKLGGAIKEKLSIPCVWDEGVMQLMRGLRAQIEGLLEGTSGAELRSWIGSTLFVVRTANKFAQTRLRIQLETSLANVSGELILPVSNRADQVSRAGGDVVRVRATLGEGLTPACGNNHDKGMCCIEGRALYYARHQPGRWSWAIVVDDDVYVDVPNLLTMVAELNSTAPILYGIGGCNKGPLSCGDLSKPPSYSGLCGGAGYLIARRHLERLVGDADLASWMRRWMELGAWVQNRTGGWWSDVTAGCAAQRAGLRIMRDRRDRMHGWPLKPGRGPARFSQIPVDRGEMRDSLRRGGATYHYVGRFGMPGMEEMHGIARTAREGGGAYHGLAPTSELKSKISTRHLYASRRRRRRRNRRCSQRRRC